MIKEIKNNYPLIMLMLLCFCVYAFFLYEAKSHDNEKTITELQIELTTLEIKKLKGLCNATII